MTDNIDDYLKEVLKRSELATPRLARYCQKLRYELLNIKQSGTRPHPERAGEIVRTYESELAAKVLDLKLEEMDDVK